MVLIFFGVANMTVMPVLFFLFLTLPDCAHISDSSLNTEAVQAAKKHDRGPTGLAARSTKSHGPLDSALYEIYWELHKIWTNNLICVATFQSSTFGSDNPKSNHETEKLQ